MRSRSATFAALLALLSVSECLLVAPLSCRRCAAVVSLRMAEKDAETAATSDAALAETPATANATAAAEAFKPGESDFIAWVKNEQALEEWKKENPRDVIGDAAKRLQSVLPAIAIIGAGFYAIPLIKRIVDATQGGGVDAIINSLANPVKTL